MGQSSGLPQPSVFKRSSDLQATRIYMGSIMSFLAKGNETEGRFAMLDFQTRPGHEPPPHVHDREHEVYYVLEGVMEFYCDNQILTVRQGETLFLPQGQPHAFYCRSSKVRALLMVIATDERPVGLDHYFWTISNPAKSLDFPEHPVTYLEDDLAEAIKLAEQNGCRALTPPEVAAYLPQYPGFGIKMSLLDN